MPDALRFLILTASGWVNRHQEDVIDYLREENRVLREQRGPRPLRLTDAQRRRLAVRGQKLGRRILAQVAGIVTPDTILRSYRRLIAQKYDGSAHRRRGRPRRCCTNRHWPARGQSTGSSPADAIRRWSAESGHPIQNLTAEDYLTPLPGWAPGAKAIADDGLVAEERILHPALTMGP